MLVRTLITAAALLLPAAASAQSFNCRYARFADEVAICQSPLLSRLDERMSRIFYETRNDIDGTRDELDADQDAWLRTRRSCGRDDACIEDAYRDRIRELRAY